MCGAAASDVLMKQERQIGKAALIAYARMRGSEGSISALSVLRSCADDFIPYQQSFDR
jgi:hypothetical protein